jgi:isopenicillin N synthase-like dioxygenase
MSTATRRPARLFRALMEGLQRFGFLVLKITASPPSCSAAPTAWRRRCSRWRSRSSAATPRAARLHALRRGARQGQRRPDLKEFWQIGHEGDGFTANVWPAEVPGFEETFRRLFDALNETGLALLQALAPRLDLTEHHFDPSFARDLASCACCTIPPLAPGVDPECVRSAAHEDINFLTIMVAAKGAGLELLDRTGPGCRWRPSPRTSSWTPATCWRG